MSAFTALFLLFPAACATGPARPEVPKEIAVPPGHHLLLTVKARGVQIYRAEGDAPGELKWVLHAPLAELFDARGARAGFHYDGPSWEALDGSKVVREEATEVRAPNAGDIPWLLVKVKAQEGKAGVFSPAVYIQRLETEGGVEPAGQPKRAGTRIGVAYNAVYYLYARSR